jgi:hypothetical protein
LEGKVIRLVTRKNPLSSAILKEKRGRRKFPPTRKNNKKCRFERKSHPVSNGENCLKNAISEKKSHRGKISPMRKVYENRSCGGKKLMFWKTMFTLYQSLSE